MKFVRGTIPGFEGERDIAVIEGDTHIGAWVEQTKRLDHDQHTLPRLAKFIDHESVVYDVGANIGDHTAFYASLHPRAVVAFEPYEDAFDCLYHNTQNHRGIVLCNVAVGNGELISMAGDEPNKGARHIVAESSAYGQRSMRIDDMVGDLLPPTFIKLDIEGWEVRALLGAEKTIKMLHPIIVCEVNVGALARAGTSAEELHALLTDYGYKMADLLGKPWDTVGDMQHFDVVAVQQ
jgi:FkbM family methyltransferase